MRRPKYPGILLPVTKCSIQGNNTSYNTLAAFLTRREITEEHTPGLITGKGTPWTLLFQEAGIPSQTRGCHDGQLSRSRSFPTFFETAPEEKRQREIGGGRDNAGGGGGENGSRRHIKENTGSTERGVTPRPRKIPPRGAAGTARRTVGALPHSLPPLSRPAPHPAPRLRNVRQRPPGSAARCPPHPVTPGSDRPGDAALCRGAGWLRGRGRR